MIRLLRVRNFALIDEITLELEAGLNVLTGETGAGKSLIVDALGLIAGARASSDTIRSGAERAVVEVVADLPEDGVGFPDLGLDPPRESDTLVLRREIASDGRNRVFINNQPATVSALRTIASSLLDIHGQNEQQSLLSSETQLALIDRAAGTETLCRALGKLHSGLRKLHDELDHLDSGEADILQRQDFLLFQKDEIERIHPKAGEGEELRTRVRALEHSGKLLDAAGSAYHALYESDVSILGHLASLQRSLEGETANDPRLQTIVDLIGAGRASLEEASWELRDYLNQLDTDPGALEQMQSRLSELERLGRKYGPDLLAHLETVRQELDSIGLREDRRSSVIAELEALRRDYDEAAGELSHTRRECALSLGEEITGEIRTLAMPQATFSIEWETLPDGGRTGIDRPVWCLAANAGEDKGALSAIASGGEISRTMLAVRSVLAGNLQGRTLVFDEIDAGVGGEAAERVGRKLKALAKSCQVLSVTHLPQIARFADHHSRIAKTVRDGRTRTGIELLDAEGRVEELARMMSGKRITEAARLHVRELLDRK